MKNTVKFEFLSLSENEALARSVAAAFIMPLDPTLEELADVANRRQRSGHERDSSRIQKKERYGSHGMQAGRKTAGYFNYGFRLRY